MDRGAWWAVIHRVTKSQTRLKRCSAHNCNRGLEVNLVCQKKIFRKNLKLDLRDGQKPSLCENWNDEDFQAERITLDGKRLVMLKVRGPFRCNNQ